MECVICKHGTTRSSFVTVTLERDNCIVILKQVPADVCQNCGDDYLSEAVTAEVLQKVDVPIRLTSTGDCDSPYSHSEPAVLNIFFDPIIDIFQKLGCRDAS